MKKQFIILNVLYELFALLFLYLAFIKCTKWYVVFVFVGMILFLGFSFTPVEKLIYIEEIKKRSNKNIDIIIKLLQIALIIAIANYDNISIFLFAYITILIINVVNRYYQYLDISKCKYNNHEIDELIDKFRDTELFNDLNPLNKKVLSMIFILSLSYMLPKRGLFTIMIIAIIVIYLMIMLIRIIKCLKFHDISFKTQVIYSLVIIISIPIIIYFSLIRDSSVVTGIILGLNTSMMMKIENKKSNNK